MSQKELAIAAGLSSRTVQRLEASGTASLETRKAIAAVFGIEAHALLEQLAPSRSGFPMKMNLIVGVMLLVTATVLLTCFVVAQLLSPVDSFDSRDLFVGSWAMAGSALSILAFLEFRRILPSRAGTKN